LALNHNLLRNIIHMIQYRFQVQSWRISMGLSEISSRRLIHFAIMLKNTPSNSLRLGLRRPRWRTRTRHDPNTTKNKQSPLLWLYNA
jgi:hypothetical protein